MSNKRTERVFVLCAFAEISEGYCDEAEAAEAILDCIESEGLSEDDFTVVRGVELSLKITKPKQGKVFLDGVEVYGVAE